MNGKFRNFIDLLEPLYRQLMAAPPVKVEALPPDMPTAGIYLFSERGRHLYVGRTNRMRARLQEHRTPVLITEHGKPSAYLVDVETFENLQQRMKILEGIARGEKAIHQGRSLPHTQAKKKMKRWLQ